MRNSLILLVAMLLFVSLSTGQGVQNTGNIGFPPNGIFSGSNFDSAQVNNGNLHIEIPAWFYEGRGLDIGTKFVYDHQGWKEHITCGHTSGLCHAAIRPDHILALHLVNPFNYNVTHKVVSPPQPPNDCASMELWFTNFTLQEPDGTKHHLLPDPAVPGGAPFCGPTGTMYADDGSGWLLATSQNGQESSLVRKDGTKIILAPGSFTQIEDTNGNFLYRDLTTAINTDTLGRQFSDNGSYFDSSGVQRALQVTYTSLSVRTDLCWFTTADTCGEWSGTVQAPQVITLPNGTAYTFTYAQNQDAAPLSVTLPTGGQISWTWDPAISLGGRRIASRTETANGQSAMTQYLSMGSSPATVIDPAGNHTKTFFNCSLVPGFRDKYIAEVAFDPPCYPSDVQYWQGSSSGGGTLLKTVHTDYSTTGTILPTRETTTWNQTNLVTKVETGYDSFPVWSGNITWRNPTSRSEYAFGTGAPGALVRTTSTTYLHQLNPSYRDANIADRVVDNVITDGAGNTKANTHTIYDQTNSLIASLAGAPNHNSAKGTSYFLRGNPTHVQRWLNSNGSWPTTFNTYDDLGNLRWTTNPDGQNSTTFSYSDNWWSNTACVPAGVNTQAYVTQITNALSQPSISHYYPCTGQLAHSRDTNDIANSRNGTVRTYDLMNRLVQTDYPDGGQTLFAFNTSTPLQKQQRDKLDSSGTLSDAYVQFDGLGRVSRTAKNSGENPSAPWDMVDTCYDLLGRKSYQSNPYRDIGFASAKSCSNSSRPGDTFAYDALSRPTQVTRSDGGTVVTSYPAGNQTIVTDEAGKKRKTEADALGRLIKVWEPDGAGNFIYETAYQYDTLDNLTRVDQKGNDPNAANWRTRTFQYDSLSRLTSATNPESGTITFGYDVDSNLISKSAPAPNQTGSATVSTSFFYDALNRLTTRCFSSGGCAGVVYDLTNVWGLNITNSIGRVVLTDTSTHNANTLSSYDPMGRPVIQVQARTGAPSQRFDYAYNLDGSLKSLTYPSGRRLDYTYNIGQRATAMVDAANSINYATGAGYTPFGALSSLVTGSSATSGGVNHTFTYNSRMQPLRTVAQGAGAASPVFDISYDFHLGAGNNGNVFQITNSRDNTRTQTFTYDELNRITSAQSQATSGSNCWGESFGYDIWANLTSRTVTKCSAEGPVPAATVKNQMAGSTYDSAGNYLPAGYSYSAENMLVAAPGSMNFEYDADLRRVKKTNGATGTLYWYGTGGEVLQETDLAGALKREFVYFNGKRIAFRTSTLQYRWYLSDHLGSSRKVISAAAGNTYEDADFYPFGGERSLVSTSGNSYKFTGKERDPETNLDYFGARYYAFNFGRFTTPDVHVPMLINPQSLNLYSYTFNNPLRMVDPNGRFPTAFHIDASAAALQTLNFQNSRVFSTTINKTLDRHHFFDNALHAMSGDNSFNHMRQGLLSMATDVSLPGSSSRGAVALVMGLHLVQDRIAHYALDGLLSHLIRYGVGDNKSPVDENAARDATQKFLNDFKTLMVAKYGEEGAQDAISAMAAAAAQLTERASKKIVSQIGNSLQQSAGDAAPGEMQVNFGSGLSPVKSNNIKEDMQRQCQLGEGRLC